MEKHVTLVGILNIVYSTLALIGSIVLYAIASNFGCIMNWASRMDRCAAHNVSPEAMSIVPIILGSIGSLILIVAIVGIIGSIGVIKKKEWGRITVLVISFFHLIHIPLGTVLGVYSIWVLLNDDTIKLFNPVLSTKSKKTTNKIG